MTRDLYQGRDPSLVLVDERTLLRLVPSLYQCAIVAAIVFLVVLGGCSGKSEPITMTVINVKPDKSGWGCIAQDYRTYMRSKDGRVGWICGDYGPVGSEVSGWWTEDGQYNGFHTVKP